MARQPVQHSPQFRIVAGPVTVIQLAMMTMTRFAFSRSGKGGFALLLSLALASCGTAENPTVRISVIGGATSIFDTEAGILSPGAQLVRGAASHGLVAYDEAGNLVPALAARWIVTDDGQSYIFRLGSASWRDGSPVTARQVAAALRERIENVRQGHLGPDLAGIRDIRTMTGEVIEIRLDSAIPDLLQVLAQPELGISRKGEGSGPLSKVREANRLDFTAKPEQNADSRDDDSTAQLLPAIILRAESAARAIARYDMGYADMVLNGRFHNLPLVDYAGISRSDLTLDPVSGLFGLQFVEADGFLSDAGIREAVSMAIDRERIRASLNIESAEISNRIVPPFVADFDSIAGEPWAGRTMTSRRVVARSRISSWTANFGAAPSLRIALPDGPGASLLFASIAADLRIAGLKAVRVGYAANADLRLVDEVATYNRPTWYLNQLACVRRRVCDEAATALLQQARMSRDGDESRRLLAQAEKNMVDYHGFIVLGQPIRWSLVRGKPAGFLPNPLGYHPLSPMAAIPR